MIVWYLARGAGIAAFATLSLATAAGAVTSRRQADFGRRVVLQYVHRAAALAGVSLLALHVGTVLADSYARVGVRGAVLPFGSAYRPAAVTLGVLSMYLLVGVAVTGMLRSSFASSAAAARLWRRFHLCAYAAWAMSAWHFLLVGTDSGRWWARAVLVAGILVVGAGVTARLADRSLITTRRLAPTATTATTTSVGAPR